MLEEEKALSAMAKDNIIKYILLYKATKLEET
jgi:hypothetical protein